MIRLNVNIDHIATVRQARRTFEPSLAAAASIADLAGADGITVHLRTDRRHIQDEDLRLLRSVVRTHLNLEMASTEEMLRIACEVKPNTVTLVPERPDEITTEGGLDIVANEKQLTHAASVLRDAGIITSMFLDPVPAQIEAAARTGARQIEICTSRYSDLTDPTRPGGSDEVKTEVDRISQCARMGAHHGLQIAAGHGLTYRNVSIICGIKPMEELNIGHNIVARAVLVGLERAVREMITAMAGRPDR
ncbi:MAG TPA: pyridoxine 5'-phosphate synthase [Blastocatellia bacterium]|nr:pyridoxine 5'-phosphate synthase [Blastocatellia bacterium]